jgi:hypothetical protein
MTSDKKMTEEEQVNEIKKSLAAKGAVTFFLYRLEFQARENLEQPGEEFLRTFSVDYTIPEIIEAAGRERGGGAYRLDLKHMDRVLSQQPFEIAGLPKPFKRPSIFKPVIERWYNEAAEVPGIERWYNEAAEVPGAQESEYFDEKAYSKFNREFAEHGVEDFLKFLSSLYIYKEANKFLIECLHKAQDHGWDT